MSESRLSIPAFLQKKASKAGSHRRGTKCIVTGATGTGKSFFAASAPGEPGERIIIECGESGIEPYLPKEEQGYCFTVLDVETFHKTIEWVFKEDARNPGRIKSVIIDPINLQWTEQLDWWNDYLQGDIGAGDWRKVKAPWKLDLRRLTQASFNVVMTCHLRDVEYVTEETAGKTKIAGIREQAVPNIEKNTPYIVDFIFLTDVAKDNLNRPLPLHYVTLLKGRRPHSIPPDQLHVGKTWKFNAKKPASPWDTIIDPIEKQWKDGAVEYISPVADLAEEQNNATRAAYDVAQVGEDAEVARLKRLFEQAKTLAELKTAFEENVSIISGLSRENQRQVNTFKDQRKAALSGTEN